MSANDQVYGAGSSTIFLAPGATVGCSYFGPIAGQNGILLKPGNTGVIFIGTTLNNSASLIAGATLLGQSGMHYAMDLLEKLAIDGRAPFYLMNTNGATVAVYRIVTNSSPL